MFFEKHFYRQTLQYFAAILFQGMRIVQGPDEFVESFLGAKREAAASFGIDTILLEKYITQPRHVEVQVKFSKPSIFCLAIHKLCIYVICIYKQKNSCLCIEILIFLF